MTTHYLPNTAQLAMFKEKASAEYWDKHWSSFEFKKTLQNTWSSIFSEVVHKYLVKGSKILEAGSGAGNVLGALKNNGYQVTGIDIAGETLARLKEIDNSLSLARTDVHSLPFVDQSFDGVISGGVIEHFWDGFEQPLSEAARVLRKGGFLFLTFPYRSPLRRLKLFFNCYSSLREEREVERVRSNFYQYFLKREEVLSFTRELGFKTVEVRALDGIKGFKDEVSWAKPFLQEIYDNVSPNSFKYRALDRALRIFSGHIARCVLQKVSS